MTAACHKPPLYTLYTSRTGETWVFVCDDSMKGLHDVWKQAQAWAFDRELSFNSLDMKAVLFRLADLVEGTCNGK